MHEIGVSFSIFCISCGKSTINKGVFLLLGCATHTKDSNNLGALFWVM